ncbi:osomolarity two-component system, sensor histidine kinase SLN1 [Geosmithia morbida]|uniref:histidine kinase n=1 Tax=Geosmithia morbida TaxID=1094350 RepID=A0A9P5D774_9HYPO|nr:osomolarity two-component system, sensor histidine kinase SLN1 [Geosmithia morbida]KAF4124249.1 osomolarity two-component system, sensor histidine kinase SLN1 [Geosmithia morbida]
MRIAIREQLALLVLSTTLVALAVVSVPTWLYVNNHIAGNLRSGLSLTASLKASRITSLLELIQTSCYTMGSRLLIQEALGDFYSLGESNWQGAAIDITSALSVGATTGLLQVRIYSRNRTGNPLGLLNVTAANVPHIVLPYTAPNGSQVTLGDPDYGYPPMLYPNITYLDLDRGNAIRPDVPATVAEAFPGVRISRNGGLLLGPLAINETTALVSVSVPIRDNNDRFILGYMTVLATASPIIQVRDSREGMGESGMVLIVGPTEASNRFDASLPPSNETYTPPRDEFAKLDVHFVLPPNAEDDESLGRHSDHLLSRGTAGDPFPVADYPAALAAFSGRSETVNNASAMLHTRNEQGVKVSVGYARTQTPLANWTVIVEKSKKEAYQPISTLSDILLGTVFGTAAILALLALPCAHVGVMPIRKLKAATEKSVSPPGYEECFTDSDGYSSDLPPTASQKSKRNIITTVSHLLWRAKPANATASHDTARRTFKIPGKVDVRRHWIRDELTELTDTFNSMSDELVKQYNSLDDKVAERTKQLSESKKAAEAANESKTLFIANISHELKTPLNGILGLCAVCMEETDIAKIKQSLKVVYGSGDLLLHLLEDLLSFSKNQIGHQVMVEPRVFRLADVRSQILAIFDKQAREGQIDFSVSFSSACSLFEGDGEPYQSTPSPNLPKVPKLEDVALWGDQHRILQVIINLVGNSLKFTPSQGRVEVSIRCAGEDTPSQQHEDVSRSSSVSKGHSRGARRRRGSSSVQSTVSAAAAGGPAASGPSLGRTALAINPMEPKASSMSDAGAVPGSKTFLFEFVVRDTGPGIPQHLQDKVFEPFVQGDPGLSKKFGGTGLGLSICQQLASLMGGSIDLDSTEGSGSTFTMRIPLRFARGRWSSVDCTAGGGENAAPEPGWGPQADGGGSSTGSTAPDPAAWAGGAGTPRRSLEERTPSSSLSSQPRLVGLRQPYFSVNLPTATGPSESSPSPSLPSVIKKAAAAAARDGDDAQTSKLRVLVADDNSTNVEVVRRMLKLEDISDVTIAKDGQEAYELVKSTMESNDPFDVIFMDVQMPNVDGLQSTRLIRGMGFTSPIVALTAFSEESNVRECINSGMNEFLSKPIRRPALKQVLQQFATIPEEPESPSSPTLPASRKVRPLSLSPTSNPHPSPAAANADAAAAAAVSLHAGEEERGETELPPSPPFHDSR